ncbi:helix-turn-helix transcriptional regulator [Streptomyces griseoviridis]|uniref:helix-turn-helix transcriptional regulator n=1 Tax=Streptomyces griseoviridis TaxID=45398 RepID=UPI00342F8936
MDNRAEIRAFLKSRRDRVTPEQAGLPVYGNRRVAGLRRNEVALLAGMSVEYYTRLERGGLGGASDAVLDALGRALRLDDTERAHLYDLRATASGSARARRGAPARPAVRAGVRRMLDAMPTLPVLVTDQRFDVLLANPLARALYAPAFEDALGKAANTARFCFLSPAARQYYVDWEQIARTAVGALRVAAAKDPYDRALSDLIGELSTRSDTFRVLWGAQDVRVFRDGTKRFRHPVVGRLDLDHETMFLAADDQVCVAVYSAVPGSASEDGLKLLASWAATTGDRASEGSEGSGQSEAPEETDAEG